MYQFQLMGKLAPHLGRDVMERVFLKRFTELCASPMLMLRKLCAGNFGDFCFVVGKESLEKTLVGIFSNSSLLHCLSYCI